MLVLTRKIAESLIIGDDIKITLIKIIGKEAYFSIEAPDGIEIATTESALSGKSKPRGHTPPK